MMITWTSRKEDLRFPRLPDSWEPAARHAATGAVFLPVEELLSDRASVGFDRGGLWQGGRVVRWTSKSEGEELALTFDLEEDGNYDLRLDCRMAPGSGRFSAMLNGASTLSGKSIDLSTDYRELSRIFGMGTHSLKKGKQRLVLVAGEGGKAIGLDFLMLMRRK